jgi:S1-C subfamily serine protease
MSSFFDKVKRSLGIADKKEEKGHILGTRESNGKATKKSGSSAGTSVDTASSGGAKIIEVCFEEPTMGMQVEATDGGLPLITKVFSGNAADQKGVRVGDMIIGIDGVDTVSYDACMQILKNPARPMNVR